MEGYLKCTERGNDLKTEVVAGATAFLAMGSIVFFNPGILREAGVPSTVAFLDAAGVLAVRFG